MFSKTRVAVLRGGPSSEYEVSLKTGASVLAHLPESYHPLDVFVDRKGSWHLLGKMEPIEKILGKVDIVWNALHGEYGEDGAIQTILETHGIPFSGSRRLAAALSFNKSLAKKIVERSGIKTPHSRVLKQEDYTSGEALAQELYRAFPQPSIIKPVGRGSSIGVSFAETPEEIWTALSVAFSVSETILIEEYIEGKEASLGVIEGFRGEPYYALMPVQVAVAPDKKFFDQQTKYSGAALHQCPGNFSNSEKSELAKLAIAIHRLLDLRHYSRSEFIVHPKRGIFFLETDALPDLHEGISPYLQSLQSAGATFSEFLEHVLTLARSGK